MRPLMRNVSIRTKLPMIVMFTSGVALLIACGVFLFYDQANARRTLERDLSILTEIVSAQSAAAVAFDDRKGVDEILSALAAQRHMVVAAVIGKDGQVLARHPRTGPPPPPAIEDGLRYEEGHLVIARPILQEGRRIGTFYARSDLEEVRSHLKRALGAVLLILGASSIAAFALSLKLGAMITRPVLGLAETMRTVSARGDYALRAAPAGRDEVGQLIEGFNAMLERIRERDAALEGKVREVTETQLRLAAQGAELGTYHDLVTHDVTNFAGTLMIIVERLLSRGDGELGPKQQELLRRANRQIFKLNQLSANAKTLVRLREKGLPPAGGPVRLSPLLGHVIETVRAVHFDRPFEARVDCADRIRVAHIPFIENVFMNLADNAVRHTPREAAMVLRVLAREEGREVIVTVRGGRPVDDDASRNRLFDRHVRGPNSSGGGLGLFVVREIVERAGGRVSLGTAREPEGAVFEVSLALPGA